MSLEFITVIYI